MVKPQALGLFKAFGKALLGQQVIRSKLLERETHHNVFRPYFRISGSGVENTR